MESTSASLAGFPLFSELPKELRLRIWEMVCSNERIIPILPGIGHLNPLTHRHLAVPPLLHVCAESRTVGLAHYSTHFHPQIYTNPKIDLVMLHITFPKERIDKLLYHSKDFNWAAVPRMAVFLDDASNLNVKPFAGTHLQRRLGWGGPPPPPDLYRREWSFQDGKMESYLPFSESFMWTLNGYPWSGTDKCSGPKELVLLLLPPLTARPNPMAQRIEIVHPPEDIIAGLHDIEQFLNSEIASRLKEHVWQWQVDTPLKPPKVTVRFATCTPWEAPPPGSYAGEATGWKEVDPPGLPTHWVNTLDELIAEEMAEEALHNAWSHINSRDEQREDEIRRLRDLYDHEVGLGPHTIWERTIHSCGTGMMLSPYGYEGNRLTLWRAELPAEEQEKLEWLRGVKTLRWNGVGP